MYIKEFLNVLLLLCVGIAVIFSIIGLIDKVDDFLPHNPALSLLIEYAVLSVPRNANYLLPMAIMLSGLFVFSQANSRKEIVAIKAAGGKIKSLLVPFAAAGVMLTIFAYILSEVIVPAASGRVSEIKNIITKKERRLALKDGSVYMRAKDGSVVRITLYMPDKKIMRGLTIFKLDSGRLKERIDAESGEWADNGWKLKGVTVYNIDEGTSAALPELAYKGEASPEIFQEGLWKVEEMSLLYLIKYNKRLQEAGFKNIKLIVDISARLSYPLINLFILLFGISLAVSGDWTEHNRLFKNITSGSGVIAAGLGLIMSLIYWFGYSFFLSLGYAGTIPPIIAPWIIPLAFAVITIYMFRRIHE